MMIRTYSQATTRKSLSITHTEKNKRGKRRELRNGNTRTKNETNHKEGKGRHNKATSSEKIPMIKHNPSQEVMEEAEEITKRDKETFSAEECKGKMGDPIELKKYLHVATEKSIKKERLKTLYSKGQ